MYKRQHLQRGTPYVYQGEELGMTNYPFTELTALDDVESRNWSREALERGMPFEQVLAAVNVQSRDHARTPMQWDASPHAGFTSGTPWLPVNPNHVTINAAAQVNDPDSVFAHYQRLIRLRHEEPIVVAGDFTMLLPDHPQVFAYLRRLPATPESAAGSEGPRELLVVANLGDDAVDVELPPEWEHSEIVLRSAPDEVASNPEAGMPWGRLLPWEARIHRR